MNPCTVEHTLKNGMKSPTARSQRTPTSNGYGTRPRRGSGTRGGSGSAPAGGAGDRGDHDRRGEAEEEGASRAASCCVSRGGTRQKINYTGFYAWTSGHHGVYHAAAAGARDGAGGDCSGAAAAVKVGAVVDVGVASPIVAEGARGVAGS